MEVHRKAAIRFLFASLIGLAGVVGTLLLLSQAASARPLLQEGDLVISKVESADPVLVGAHLVYTLTYQNTSTDTVSGVVITDTLDPNVTYVSASLAPDGGTGQNAPYWIINTLSESVSGTIVLTVAVDNLLPNGTILTNTAIIDGNETVSESAQITTTVDAPTLELIKSDDPDPVPSGAPLTYILAYGNTGDATATGVVITDVLDSNVTFVSASPTPTDWTTPTLSWSIGPLTPSILGEIVISVTVQGALDEDITLTNSAAIDSQHTVPFSVTEATAVISHSTPVSVVLIPVTATVIAGQSISYTLVATDAFGNDWDATAAGTYTITPGAGGSWASNVYTSHVAGTWTVTGTYGGENGTATLTVNPGALDHFTFDSIADQEAGQPFGVTITAYDAHDNLKTDYTGLATLADTTGTISPTVTGSFTGGEWAGDVTITRTQVGVTIMAQDGGALGVSNGFDVKPGALDHFSFDSIADQGAGQSFGVTITAYDAYANLKTDYTGSATLTDTTGTIDPTTTGNFTSGEWTGDVTITRTQTGATITAQDGGALGVSNGFDVKPGALDHFTFDSIPDQTAGQSFGVTITAYDAYANLKTDYTGSATLTDTTGTIDPTATGNFAGGEWTGDVTITRAQTGVTIMARDGGAWGVSNGFDVDPGALDHLVVSPDLAVILAGDAQAYTAEAFDVFDNSRGDVTAQTAFSILEGGHGGYWTNNVYTSHNRGDWTVQGVYTGTRVTTDTASLTVLAPVLHLEKSDDPDIVEAGATLTYTLTYSNTGDAKATNAVITDVLDSNVSFVTASLMPSGGLPDAPFWSLGEIMTDELSQITLTVAVARPLPNGTKLINTAWLDSDRTTPLSATQETIVHSRPVLTITKTDAPDPVPAKDVLRYTLIITNNGNENATSVTVTEHYDSNVSFSFSMPTDPDPGTENQWTFPTLAVDHSESINIIVNVTDTLPVGTVLTNQATLDSDQTTPITVTEVTSVTTISELTVSKVDLSDPVQAGENLMYIISYQNPVSATALAEGVVITETYDSRVTFISASRSPRAGTNNVWDIGDLNVGDFGTILVTVRVDTPLTNGTVLTNCVTIDSVYTSPRVFTETTTVSSAPDLALTITDQPDPVEAGDPLSYTLRYTNTGNADATQVVVTATLDSYVSFSGATPEPTGGVDNVRYWELDKISGMDGLGGFGYGEIVIHTTVTLPLTNSTKLDFVAQLGDAEGDLLERTAQTTVSSAPILSLDKSDGVYTVYAGDRLTYTLTYTNSGNENAYDVIITDTLPDYVQYVDCQVAGDDCHLASADEVVFHIPAVVAQTGDQAWLVVQVEDPLPAGADFVINHARMAHLSLSAPVDVYDVDPIGTRPDLTIAVDHMPYLFSPAKLMTYTVTYGNKGQHMDAEDVIITTILPTYTTYIGHGWTASDGGTYTYHHEGDLSADSTGHTITFTVKYTNQQEIGDPEFVTPFTIAGDGGTGRDADSKDNTYFVRIGVPDLIVVDVTIEPSPLKPDVPVTFTILLENQGKGWALNPDLYPGQAGSAVDVFIAPVDSYPWTHYSEKDIWAYFPAIAPGVQETVVITLTGTGRELVLFSEQEIEEIREFYVKVDNFELYPYGLVPESNEMNNVKGPISPYPNSSLVYLPLVLKAGAGQ